jgi:hypothetical protein
MGKVKQLWQDERDQRWQSYYDDYLVENFGGRNVVGRENDEACDYANDMMEEEDDANSKFGVGA